VRRTRVVILAALADRYTTGDIRCTVMRLAITERLVETGGK
jgi:hypothetical protein